MTTTTCAYVFPGGETCTEAGRHDMHVAGGPVHKLPTGERIGEDPGSTPCMADLSAELVAYENLNREPDAELWLNLGAQTIQVVTQAAAERTVNVLLTLASDVHRYSLGLEPGADSDVIGAAAAKAVAHFTQHVTTAVREDS